MVVMALMTTMIAKLDVNDSCPEGDTNWLSTTDATTGTDKDDDGCQDATSEDKDGGDGTDEDNDGISGTDANSIELDKCENGDKGWTSNDQTDNDSAMVVGMLARIPMTTMTPS